MPVYNLMVELYTIPPALVVIFFTFKLFRYSQVDRLKAYISVSIFATLSLGTDVVSAICIMRGNSIPTTINILVNTVYFCLCGIATFFFLIYVAGFNTNSNCNKSMIKLSKVFLFVYLSLFLINSYSHVIFYFDNGKYTKGIIYPIVYLLPVTMMFISLVALVLNEASLNVVVKNICIVLIALSGGMIQFIFLPDVLLANSTPIFAIIVSMVLFISPNYGHLLHRKDTVIDENRSIIEQNNNSQYLEELKKTEELNFSHEFIYMLSTCIDHIFPKVRNMSELVANLSKQIALEMGKDQTYADELYYTALVYNIGYVTIDDKIKAKKGEYTEVERGKLKDHTKAGYKILKIMTDYPQFAEAARSHHEWFNGEGYPDKIKGQDIPLSARIIGVADTYITMTKQERTGRDVYTSEEAIREINERSGTQFDPEVVAALNRKMHNINI